MGNNFLLFFEFLNSKKYLSFFNINLYSRGYFYKFCFYLKMFEVPLPKKCSTRRTQKIIHIGVQKIYIRFKQTMKFSIVQSRLQEEENPTYALLYNIALRRECTGELQEFTVVCARFGCADQTSVTQLPVKHINIIYFYVALCFRLERFYVYTYMHTYLVQFLKYMNHLKSGDFSNSEM